MAPLPWHWHCHQAAAGTAAIGTTDVALATIPSALAVGMGVVGTGIGANTVVVGIYNVTPGDTANLGVGKIRLSIPTIGAVDNGFDSTGAVSENLTFAAGGKDYTAGNLFTIGNTFAASTSAADLTCKVASVNHTTTVATLGSVDKTTNGTSAAGSYIVSLASTTDLTVGMAVSPYNSLNQSSRAAGISEYTAVAGIFGVTPGDTTNLTTGQIKLTLPTSSSVGSNISLTFVSGGSGYAATAANASGNGGPPPLTSRLPRGSVRSVDPVRLNSSREIPCSR